MFIPRLFLENPITVGETAVLSDDQMHYLQQVLRVKLGDPIIIWNGLGGEYAATVCHLNKKQVVIQIQSFHSIERESACKIELAIALLPSDKMDFVMQKAVELGVSSILPIHCERSIAKLSADKLSKKMAHWQGVIRSAANQSKRTKLPSLTPPNTFESCWHHFSSPVILFTPPIHQDSARALPLTCQHCRILIGPEAGFSDTELAYAEQKSAFFKTLGPRTLRVETAAISCLSYIQTRWGDFELN